ncbi:TonB-dependent siderophore receptor [Aurantimonas sp. Leaf443]|uniref:TonB-dependent siderophore receptor n=1 Tax=Aurantimonas sp. Leaf443 TaxID=1736378 RepID=UPI0006F6F764|nr:TonB-dependent siderophore receptor [Aurantimonas sp. Leaf443]KQT85394.1 outer membrane receptor protein [Aurantimonas sp. Leaf443]
MSSCLITPSGRPRFPSAAARGLPRLVAGLSLSSALVAVAVSQAGAQTAAVQLETVTIEGEASTAQAGDTGLAAEGYVPAAAVSATKTDTPLERVPQSVSVVTREQLEDRNVQTLLEALNYTPGVRTGAFGFDPRFDAFSIRGFPATYTGIFRDGLREFNTGFSTFDIEPYTLGGIAILKGPSAGLYGSSNPGGIVDLRSKRPEQEAMREVEAQLGTNERYQGGFDATGPLGSGGAVSYRLTGVARDAGTDNPFVADDRLDVAPALTWSPDADTRLTILSELQRSRSGGSAAYINENRRATDLPYGDPNFNELDQEQGRIGFEFEQRLNETFVFRQKARYQALDVYAEYAYPIGAPVGGIQARGAGNLDQSLKGVVSDTQLEAKFATGPLGHTVIGGLDGSYADFENREGFGAAPSLNLATLDYSQSFDTPDYSVAQKQSQGQIGLYLQDEITYDRFTLTLGGRQDWLETKTRAGTPDDLGDEDRQRDDAFSGRVGLSYLFDSGIAPYVSYATSFAPVIGTAADGTAFKPTEAEQYEAGVKYRVPGLNAFLTASVFELTQQNGVFLRPSEDFSTNVTVQAGEIRSRGVELEGTATLWSGFDVVASYAYIDVETIEGAPGTVGKQLSSTPHHSASIWGDYTIQDGMLAGLGAGAGLRYLSKSYGDEENTFENDARTFVDAAVHYDFPQVEGLRLQVNAKNIFDEDAQVCSSGFCYKEPERQVIGTLRFRF